MPIGHQVAHLVILPLPLKTSLDDFQQGSVCNLSLTVCLWVGRGGIMILDSEVLTEVPEKGVVKLPPIVGY